MAATKKTAPDTRFSAIQGDTPEAREYECECGKKMKYDSPEKIEKLARCWECAIKNSKSPDDIFVKLKKKKT